MKKLDSLIERIEALVVKHVEEALRHPAGTAIRTSNRTAAAEYAAILTALKARTINHDA